MTSPPPPPADGLTEKQQRVLDAALEVFAERGFHGASTSEIAKRAGVAEGTLFKQYKTKKDLLLGTIAPFFTRIMAPLMLSDVRAILQAPHGSVEDFLRAIYSNRLVFVHKHQRILKIALQEVPFHDEVRTLAKETVAQQLLPHALALIVGFQQRGLIRPADPLSVVRLVVGCFFTFAVTRLLLAPDRAWKDDEEIELMVQVLAQGLRPPSRA